MDEKIKEEEEECEHLDLEHSYVCTECKNQFCIYGEFEVDCFCPQCGSLANRVGVSCCNCIEELDATTY